MSDRDVAPLETLDEFLAFKNPLPCNAVEPLRDVKRGKPDDPKVLFCLDAMESFPADRFIDGHDRSDSYRFHHWQLINTFVYFSRHLVTIPPTGWISAGHKHGVKVLGTFTVESGPVAKTLSNMKRGNLVSIVASQLAHVAASCKFDGWLINIQCAMAKTCCPFLLDFLRDVTFETHNSVSGSLIIWYDSVLLNGKLDWQNELNNENSCFFNLCDGIFLNYDWTEEMLLNSAGRAKSRKSDVYAGIYVPAPEVGYRGSHRTSRVSTAEAVIRGLLLDTGKEW